MVILFMTEVGFNNIRFVGALRGDFARISSVLLANTACRIGI